MNSKEYVFNQGPEIEGVIMDEARRFDIFCEKHIGFGIRWENGPIYAFPFTLSIAFPVVTITIGFGKRR